MATPDLSLRELRLWCLDHDGGSLRLTRAAAGVASHGVLFGLGLV